MRIGELAKSAKCDAQTIRHYEREGLLPPPERNESGYRDFRGSDLERLRFIRNCRGLEMPLKEIKTLLDYREHPDLGCGEVNEILSHHITTLEEKLVTLNNLHDTLLKLQQSCGSERRAGECGILESLESPDRPRES